MDGARRLRRATSDRARRTVAVAAIAGTLVAGCATVPSAPSVLVLPGSGKTLDEFQMDDAFCRRSAAQVTEADTRSRIPAQRRFDMGYMQCMYSRGHQVPGTGGRPGAIAPPSTGSIEAVPPTTTR